MLPDLPPDQPESARTPAGPARAERLVALIEVLICSDFPTQLALGATFTALGFGPGLSAGRLQIGYIVALSLTDALLLIGLIVLFLTAHGERPREVIFGRRPIASEAARGLPMVFVALAIGTAVLLAIQYLAPSLRTVPQNPLQDLLGRPRNVWLFALVVVVAGGVREEIQRAFLLHRFEQSLGGGTIGVIVTSAAFGAGHLIQGADAVVATGLLGAFWAVVYLRRRSAVAPIVSHAGFDLLQIAQFLIVGR